MTLRGRIVIGSAAALLGLFAIGVLAVLGVTQTRAGRERIRELVVSALQSRIHGKLYVGPITEGFFTGVAIDSIAIRDPHDTLFVSAGRVSADYDLRDLLARRIILKNVHVEHPVVYIRQHEDGTWNFREIFPPGKPEPFTPKSASPLIVFDSVTVSDATFMLTLPWHVSTMFKGAARDSVIRDVMATPDHEVRRSKEGYTRTWRWTRGNATIVHGMVSDPDTVGMKFILAKVGATEADPPFVFSNVSGMVRQIDDSIWITAPHFDLPGIDGERARQDRLGQ